MIYTLKSKDAKPTIYVSSQSYLLKEAHRKIPMSKFPVIPNEIHCSLVTHKNTLSYKYM